MRQTIELAGEIAGRRRPTDPDDRDTTTGPLAGNAKRTEGSARIRLVRPLPESAVNREPRAQARPTAPAVPLIGREREVEELRATLDAALGGEGRVVLLGGEPGIGKTRLATALADEAESRGVPVWWGRSWEHGETPPFWTWNTALRRWMDRVGDEAVTAAAGSRIPDLAHVFPVLRDRLPELASSAPSESGERFRLFDTASRFLGALARPAGLVVVLDDVHWADSASMELLEFVAATLTDMRLAVVATYRDTEAQRGHPFFATLSRLAREPSTSRILLSGLSPAHCARWLTLAKARGAAGVLGDVLHRETNGNPFFLGEIVRTQTTDEDGTPWGTRRVPHGVREVIARRLDRLGRDCRTSLGVAALFDDTVDAETLAGLLGDVPLADHLERAVRDRILVEDDARPRRYGFAHALVRRVLLDELPPSARTTWHCRIAAVLE